MNYILFNYGETPDHIKYTLNTIKSVDQNSDIYFLSNRKNNFKNLINLSFSDFPSLNEKRDFLIDYYKETPYSKEKYPLFFTSVLRIYALYEISNKLSIPVIASGGAGSLQHLYDAISLGKADAVLAASIFHFGEYSISQAKDFLRDKGVFVR